MTTACDERDRSDMEWVLESLDSDQEVRNSSERMSAAKDKGEITRASPMPPKSCLEPIAGNSRGQPRARKTLEVTRSKKQLQGLYEAVPEGTAMAKTTCCTMT